MNLAMLAAVFGNLALAARRQREWYEANAPGYARGRWAMIPAPSRDAREGWET